MASRRTARAVLTLLVLTLLTVALIAVPTQAQYRVMALAPGDDAPTLIGYDLAGETIGVEWEGVTLVNFWATWCEPCRMEMPALASIYNKRKDDGLRIYGVLQADDSPDEEIKAYVDELGLTYPVMRVQDRFSKLWGAAGIVPTSFLVSSKGKIIRRYSGATPEQVEGMMRDVHNALDGNPIEPQVIPTTPEDSPEGSPENSPKSSDENSP